MAGSGGYGGLFAKSRGGGTMTDTQFNMLFGAIVLGFLLLSFRINYSPDSIVRELRDIKDELRKTQDELRWQLHQIEENTRCLRPPVDDQDGTDLPDVLHLIYGALDRIERNTRSLLRSGEV
jgi:hypothetical protein